MAAANGKTPFLSAKFDWERETKGAVRYKERGDDPKIGTLYLRKSMLLEGEKFPKTVTVTITVG